jgi:uncharacterized protein (DUF849 family)
MEKVIITAAITGDVLPFQTRWLPITPQQIADESVRAAEAGAAMVHIHARDPKNGEPSTDVEIFRDILTRIKARSDVIINVTTGGTYGQTPEERRKLVPILKPEICSYDIGSKGSTLGGMADKIRDEDYKYPWEKKFLNTIASNVWANPYNDLIALGEAMQENEVKPEYEIFDTGWLRTAQYIIERKGGYSTPPLYFQFVMGGSCAVPATTEAFVLLKHMADDLFGKEKYQWSIMGVGYPGQFQMVCLGLMHGGHIRVGLEDNLKIGPDTLSKSNAELVEKAVRLAKELDREVASPDEARKILGLKGKDKVNF